ALVVLAQSGFHGMADQGPHGEQMALGGRRRHLHAQLWSSHRHASNFKSAALDPQLQPLVAISTHVVVISRLPSLMSASATTCCDWARRMRVDTRARLRPGAKSKRATSTIGLRGARRRTWRTWSVSFIALSITSLSGTAPPLAKSRGMIS